MSVIHLSKSVLIQRVRNLFLLSLITFSVAIFLIILIDNMFSSESIRIDKTIEAIEANNKRKFIRGRDKNAEEIVRVKNAIAENKLKVKNT